MSGLPALLGALGLVGIGFALIDLVLALFGAPIDRFWIGGNLTLGVVLLIAAAATGADVLRERLHSGEARRAGKFGTSAALTTILMLAILAGVAFLSTRYHKRFDWSEAQVHSLSDQSLKVLEGLESEVHALALYTKLDAAGPKELLDRYAYASDRFRVEVVDPNERPDVLQRHAIDPAELGQGLVRIGIGDQSTRVTELSEENVTNAIVKLTRSGAKKVYFLQGHNERAISGEPGQAKDGYARAADALRNENYQVEPLLLAARGDVPDDADVVVVAGVTRPLLQQERGALNRYLEGGGALLVLVDPRARTDFVDDLRAWGVDVGEDVIIDRRLAIFGQATTPIAQEYADHEITRDLRDASVFHVARSVRPGEGGGDWTELVLTSQHSWAERDLDQWYAEGRAELGPDDVAGPVSVAVAGTPRLAGDGAGPGDAAADTDVEVAEAGSGSETARLVVFGDADFASNELIEAYRNRDLFLNSVNWLLGDVEAIGIRPERSRASRFTLTTEDFTRIRSLSLFLLPQAIAVAGVLVWWSRRFTPGPKA